MAGISDLADTNRPMAGVDAEVFCVNLLVSAIIGPRVFRNSVRPDADVADIVRRYRAEWQRVLRLESLYEG